MLKELIWRVFFSALLFFLGFGDRLLSEVKKLAPKDVKIRVGQAGAGWVQWGSKDMAWFCSLSGSPQALQATQHPMVLAKVCQETELTA